MFHFGFWLHIGLRVVDLIAVGLWSVGVGATILALWYAWREKRI